MQVVVVVLRGRVRRHAQPQWEAVGGRRLVVVVTTGACSRLVVMTPVEARLLEVRVHGGSDGGDLLGTGGVEELSES